MRAKLFGGLVAAVLAVGACVGASTSPPTWRPATEAPPASAGPSTPGGPQTTSEPATGPVMTDRSLGVELAASGLTEPTALAFLDAESYFVTEKSTGQVHRVTGGEIGEPVLDLAVNSFDERGLLGIALHPAFAENGFVYLYWTESGEGEAGGGMLGA